MKKNYLLPFFALTFFILMINARAGICDGKPKDSEGYCNIGTLNLETNEIKLNMHYTDKNNEPMTTYRYTTTYQNNEEELLCLDSTVQKPHNPSTLVMAREINLNHAYDYAFAAAYQMFVSATLNNVIGTIGYNSTNYFAFLDYINVAERILTVRYDVYNRKGAIYTTNYGNSSLLYATWLKNAGLTFEGKKVSGVTVSTKEAKDYTYSKLYYCYAVMSCKDYGNCSMFSNEAVSNCEKYVTEGLGNNYYKNAAHNSTLTVKSYDVSFATADTASKDDGPTEEVDESTNIYTKIVPLKINGIDDVLNNLFRVNNMQPYLIISDIKCDNATCSLTDPSLLNSNLIDPNKGYTVDNFPKIKLKITGDATKYSNGDSIKVNISYRYYFPLSISNLAIFRQNTKYQRFLGLLKDSKLTSTLTINVAMSKTCSFSLDENNNPVYKVGTKKVDESSYIKNYGCCDADYDKLTDSSTKEYYKEHCDAEDIVTLKYQCDKTCDKLTSSEDKYYSSLVKQANIELIMDKVRNAENTYQKEYYDVNALVKALTKFNNYKDLTYMNSDVVSKTTEVVDSKSPSANAETLYSGKTSELTAAQTNNNYCTLYTSETDEINLPGTSMATSGEFFVFNNNTQPNIKGTISADMHTDYTRWLADYNKAIEEEKTTYEAYQNAAAIKDAYANETTKLNINACSYCDGKEDKDGNCLGTIKSYSYTSHYAMTKGNYYTISGTPIIKTDNYGSCSGEIPNLTYDAATADGTYYNAAKAKRLLLEKYKYSCEIRNNLDKYWNYNMDPDVNYYYKQNYIKNGEVVDNMTGPIPMTISTNNAKYWTHISTKTIRKDIQMPIDSKNTNVISINYGDQKFLFTVDKTPDYTATYEQTLYYKPSTFYYTLIPSGEVVSTKEESSQYIELGYVYHIELTNYQGQYYTWFTINNIGHLGNRYDKANTNSKPKSNAQNSLSKYLANNQVDQSKINSPTQDKTAFSSRCYYCDTEVLTTRDQTNPKINENFIYRAVDPSDLNPNRRTLGVNWSDKKGSSAVDLIQKIGSNVISNVDEINSTYKNLSTYNNSPKVSLLKNTKEEKVIAESTEKSYIYDDSTGKYLEYEFNLTSTDMKQIKEFNKDNDYTKMSFAKKVIADDDKTKVDSTYTCTDGKECESSFLTQMAIRSGTSDLLNTTRASKWKYYICDNVGCSWKEGKISNFLGKYPEPEDENGDKYIKPGTNFTNYP